MNLDTLLKRTLQLGFWGFSTLYHMALNMLAGLLLLLFPAEVGRVMLDGQVDGSAGIVVARVFGFQLVSVGLLFGLFGSVTDRKARRRLNYFAILSYMGGIILSCLHLYLRFHLLHKEVVFVGLMVSAIGLSLTFVCLYFLSSDGAAPSLSKKKK
jgi:hypothetical protein